MWIWRAKASVRKHCPPEAVNLLEAWRFIAGPPAGNDNLMNVKTNSQSCRVAPWQEMHVCLFTFSLSFTHTCLEGVFWLYTSWWGFLSWSGACQRSGGPAHLGVIEKPKSAVFSGGRLVLQALHGSSVDGVSQSLHSCDNAQFRQVR